jgi:lipopolysaccharide export system permease protein
MRMPLTLSRYIGRHFLLAVAATLVLMLVLIGMIELLELVRVAAKSTRNVPFGIVFEMMLLKVPVSAEKIYPFTFLIGSMVALSRLTRHSELVVTRAAGVSVWQFLMPGFVVALVLGVLFVAVLNPIGAYTISKYDRMEGKYISGISSLLSVLPSGLWLRQVGEEGIRIHGAEVAEYIVHADRIDQATLGFENATVFLFDHNHRFVGRVDAPRAQLAPGHWRMENAILAAPAARPQQLAEYTMPTQLTMAQIQDSFAAPETFSFWQLPGFIAVLEKAGFSALQHRLHFHSLMALPALLAGMVMIAAVFSLRQPRRGRTGMMVVFGMVAGFIIYFITNIIYAFGASGGLPVALAAWAPSLIVLMAGSAALLHLEDG